MKIVGGLAKKTKTVNVGAISMIFPHLNTVFVLMAKGEKKMPTTKEVDESRSPSKVLFTYGVDAVEVVRCKDCKHNYHNMIPGGEAEYGCTKCIELPITANFYCAWGERNDNN